MLSTIKRFLEGLNSPVYKAVGLDPYYILKSEIEAYMDQAKTLETEISSTFSSPVRALSAAETLFLTEYSFSISGSEIEFKTDKPVRK
ncbi:hypothetical protein ACO1D0_00125 [Bacillus licheniformis]|uniref:hypothetical protein n=1 Tax=Bacillus licheniformis TaxID=1402 RepID=UPI003BF6891F